MVETSTDGAAPAMDAETIAPVTTSTVQVPIDGLLESRSTPPSVRRGEAVKLGIDESARDEEEELAQDFVATTPEQTPLHADSCWPNSHVAARAPWGDAHLIMIVALQNGTELPIYPFHKGGERETVKLNEGDVFVGRGDVIHVGAQYDELNIRIHFYIDSPRAPEPRDNDKTYHVLQDSWPILRR